MIVHSSFTSYEPIVLDFPKRLLSSSSPVMVDQHSSTYGVGSNSARLVAAELRAWVLTWRPPAHGRPGSQSVHSLIMALLDHARSTPGLSADRSVCLRSVTVARPRTHDGPCLTIRSRCPARTNSYLMVFLFSALDQADCFISLPRRDNKRNV
ncbi:hypothetical protein RRG08_045503 [Elysia crispata]|uniref:Uncharacterized protein n=1 Tax=Elysia crispata TaxID=231223 RepID=A0AAE1AG79_9GAST|nr:hypothetical protein RRG08_045503 [Elysia crispata]